MGKLLRDIEPVSSRRYPDERMNGFQGRFKKRESRSVALARAGTDLDIGEAKRYSINNSKINLCAEFHDITTLALIV